MNLMNFNSFDEMRAPALFQPKPHAPPDFPKHSDADGDAS
jgi:hypothetical protein